jgi:uncharacterized membrane protein YphA (DoxX/SURF4 family)
MMRAVLIVLRLFLAGIFLYAAYTKLRQPWLIFAMSIDAYQMLPEWAVLLVARTLPWLELALGLLLLLGAGLRYSSAAATILLAGFFSLMLVSYQKGMSIDCGCFGLGEALTAKSLARDGALLVSAIVLCVLAFRASRRKPRFSIPAAYLQH